MPRILVVIIGVLVAGLLPSAIPKRKAVQDMTYAGTTPCGRLIRPLHGIGMSEPCDEIEWELHIAGKASGAFKVVSEYRQYVDNQTTRVAGNREIEGRWRLINVNGYGTIELKSGGHSLQLRRLDENILHITDDRGKLVVGSTGQSYTLTRTE